MVREHRPVRGGARAGGDGAHARGARRGGARRRRRASRRGRQGHAGRRRRRSQTPNDLPSGPRTGTATSVQVNFDAPTAATLDLPKCKLFINGNEQELSAPPPQLPALSRATSTLQFKWDDPVRRQRRLRLQGRAGHDDGQDGRDTRGRSTRRARPAAGSLISFQVMKDWFWFIAGGAVITVELTVISIILACIFALFGSLGPPVEEDDLQAGLGPLPELGVHVCGWCSAASPTGSRPSTPRCSAAPRCCCRSSPSTRCVPEVIKALRPADQLQPAGVLGGRRRPVAQLRRLPHRGVPRRHPGGAQGPERGRLGDRPERLADAAAHHPAAGVQDRHPGRRQRLHRPDQGHLAGVGDHRRGAAAPLAARRRGDASASSRPCWWRPPSTGR